MAVDQAELLCEKLSSLSINNPNRHKAQDEFNELKKNAPAAFFNALISIITSNKDLAIRKQAVDFMRSIICYFIDYSYHWPVVPGFMQELVNAFVKADDPLQECIQKAFCEICRSKKEKFVPYIDGLIDSILNDLKISELQSVSADGVNRMIRAVALLTTFIRVLGVQLGDNLVSAGDALVPLLSFPFDIDIKRSILTAIAELFRAAREMSATNGLARRSLSQWVEKVVTNVLKDLTPGGDDAGKIGLDWMLAETRGLNKCLRNAGPKVLKDKQLGDLCEKVFALMGESSKRCVKNAADKHYTENGYYAENGPEGSKYVEESTDRLEEKGSEQALRSTLREINAAIMMFHGDRYTSGEKWFGKFIEAHLDPNCNPDDRALALYVCGDLLKHLKGDGEALWPKFVNHVVKSVGDPDPGVRRAAAFGIIQAAEQAKFSDKLIQTAAAQIIVFLSETQSQEKAFLSATDIMVAALGAILEHRRFENATYPSQPLPEQPLPEKFVLPWINNLPLKIDDEEGRRVHGYFVGQLFTSYYGVHPRPDVVGPNNENFPRLAAICASIYHTDFSTAKIDGQIRDFITHFGFGVTSDVGVDFDKELQKGLEKIYLELNWA